ncbi:MAG: hypothetical protein FVQ83_00730 [Chloroflexi bacterium]|nr:hypothetical protein [Chloroflexota bacterium]
MMADKKRQLNFEQVLYLVAFALALGIRFINLGASPLSEFEAGWAMQAFNLSQGEATAIGSQPAYLVLTSFLFSIFGSSETLARLLPALVGSMLVWLPYSFRTKIGRTAGIVLAFGLAFDPGLVSLSRLAGSPILAMGFGLMSISAWVAAKPIPAGILGALALLSGPAALTGLLGLFFAWTLVRFLSVDEAQKTSQQPAAPDRTQVQRLSIYAGIGTLLLAGTFFLRIPQGMSALLSTIPDYFAGWSVIPEIPFGHLLLALPAYQPIALIFALIAIIRAWLQTQNTYSRILSLWFFTALGLALAYPARQVGDLVWALIPMWALAAMEIGRHLSWDSSDGMVAWGQAGLVLVLLTFLYLDIAPLGREYIDPQEHEDRLLIALGVIGIGVISTLLIGLGWVADAASRGLVWGLCIFLAVFTFAPNWRLITGPQKYANELWFPIPAAGQSSLMLNTLADISELENGTKTGIEVVYLVDLASMHWALRLLPQAKFNIQISPTDSPPAIINYIQTSNPNLPAEYRGQAFTWRIFPAWGAALPENIIRWWLFREAPTASEGVVLWVRADIFPENIFSSTETEITPNDDPYFDDIMEP